jgi:hypothetical protein
MSELSGWQLGFVAAVMIAGVLVLGYVGVRRLLNAALDDRYGQWRRFQEWSGRALPPGRRTAASLQYALTFFFSYGIHDLGRLVTLLAFDLFVLFALLAPFWRHVFFGDWSPASATALAAAGAAGYIAVKLRFGLQLCTVHHWGPPDWCCERCGEHHARAEEFAGGAAAGPSRAASFWDRLSWHGFWERRLEELNRRVTAE